MQREGAAKLNYIMRRRSMPSAVKRIDEGGVKPPNFKYNGGKIAHRVNARQWPGVI